MTVHRFGFSLRLMGLFTVLACQCSCLREDPQLQLLRAELQRTQQLLSKSEQENSSSRLTAAQREAVSSFPGLQRDYAQLKEKLELTSKELEQAKATTLRVLGEDELYLSLERAAMPLRDQVKSDYDFNGGGVKDLKRPELQDYPYSCILFLEITKRSDGQPVEMAIPVKADWKGKWVFPEMSELLAAVRPRGFYSQQMESPIAPTPPSPPPIRDPNPSSPRQAEAPAREAAPPISRPSLPNVVYRKRFNWGE